MTARPNPAPGHRLLTIDELAGRLGISVRKAWRMVTAGELPSPVKVGQRGTRFREEDIERYIASLHSR